jgi:hypothetical protein
VMGDDPVVRCAVRTPGHCIRGRRRICRSRSSPEGKATTFKASCDGMRQRLLRMAAVLTILTACWTLGSSSGAKPPSLITLSGGCSDPNPQHGFCSRMLEKPGLPPFFELESFDGGGRYKFCVRPPLKPERCLSRQLQLQSNAEAWSVRVNFFEVWRPTSGSYSGRWVNPGTGRQVGPKVGSVQTF